MSGFAQGLVAGSIALLLAIQFIRPAKTNPPIVQARTLEAAVDVPPTVEDILIRSCNDCHSDRTRWPWYSYITPVSLLVVNDVNEGRRHLNFSQWLPPDMDNPGAYTFQKFHTVCKAMQSGSMPLRVYEAVHWRARLSELDVRTVCDWTDAGVRQN